MSWEDRLVKSRASYVKPRRSQILSYRPLNAYTTLRPRITRVYSVL